MHNKAVHIISFILVVIGGLNWGLVGLFQFDLVAALLGGADSVLSRIVYVLVALAAVYLLATHKKDCRTCGMGGEHKSSGPMNQTA